MIYQEWQATTIMVTKPDGTLHRSAFTVTAPNAALQKTMVKHIGLRKEITEAHIRAYIEIVGRSLGVALTESIKNAYMTEQEFFQQVWEHIKEVHTTSGRIYFQTERPITPPSTDENKQQP